MITHISKAKRPQISPSRSKRLVLADAFCAERLHRAVHDLQRHGGHDELDAVSVNSLTLHASYELSYLGYANLFQGSFSLELIDLYAFN